MLRNLITEWLKIRNYRTFWVLLILFVLCTVGVNYVFYETKSDNNMRQVSMLIGNPFSFPDVWQTVSYISSFLLFLPGLIILILVTNEYNFKTHRQNIIDGISRFDFVTTKILIAAKLAVFATILTLLIAVFIGISGNTSISADNTVYLLYFFLQAFTYTLAGLLFGFLFKRSGIAIALYFVYLFFLKNILCFLGNHYFSNAGDYLPVKSADNLIPIPVFHNITKNIFTQPSIAVLIICTLIYIASFCLIVLRKFTSEDL